MFIVPFVFFPIWEINIQPAEILTRFDFQKIQLTHARYDMEKIFKGAKKALLKNLAPLFDDARLF